MYVGMSGKQWSTVERKVRLIVQNVQSNSHLGLSHGLCYNVTS